MVEDGGWRLGVGGEGQGDINVHKHNLPFHFHVMKYLGRGLGRLELYMIVPVLLIKC